MMTISARSASLYLAASLGLAIVPAASTASGGGGGESMPSAPSQSAPTYDAAAEYKAGVAALGAGHFEDAKRNFDHVLAVAPRTAAANYLAGVTREALKDVKGALRYFEKAVKYDDTMIMAHKEYALGLVAVGKPDKAQAELQLLRDRSAKCADTCPEAGDLREAITAISAQLGTAPQSRIDTMPDLLFGSGRAGDENYLKAVALINEHRYEDALRSLEQAERILGPHPDVLTYIGFANRKLKRYDIAERYYREALRIAPHHRGATEYYGELMVERGDLAGARQKLAALDRTCAFGCFEAEELRRWIETGHGSSS